MVLTSHQSLGDTGQKTGFWLEEFAAPYYRFVDKGHVVTLASPKGGRPPIDPKSEESEALTSLTERFRQDEDLKSKLDATRSLTEVDASEYDALFFPGGHGPMWDLAESAASRALIEAFDQARKPIGAVCHGPAVFRHVKSADGSPFVEGRDVTGFSNSEEARVGLTDVVPFLLEDELKRLGGNYSKGEDWQPYLVKGGRLVTGQNPASSVGCADGLLEILKSSSPQAASDRVEAEAKDSL